MPNKGKQERLPIVAICYDFDKTLSPDDMQAQGFIQSVGYDVAEFWKETGELARENNMDSNLSYMYKMVQEAEKFKAEDEAKKARIEAKNSLENYTFTVRNSLRDEAVSSKLAASCRRRTRRRSRRRSMRRCRGWTTTRTRRRRSTSRSRRSCRSSRRWLVMLLRVVCLVVWLVVCLEACRRVVCRRMRAVARRRMTVLTLRRWIKRFH